ncbi:hypothetical protein AB0A94_00750 [Streptomyces sp. NPDC044984]|uniref:hypothetical protein n=1 Tax=Streptomyces sp. NPDC044984 TaxID=3154335 RepID=UPI0033D7C92F
MGNSRAYPVLRTTDAAEAYRQARRLCALLEHIDDRVWLFSEMRTPGEARRMAEIVPGADFDYVDARTDPATGDFLSFDLDVTQLDDAGLREHLPLSFLEDVGRGDVEERFLAALGESTAAIEWNGRWPDDPEIDSHGHWNYDGVQIVFHGDEAQYGDKWTEGHTVFVHVTKHGDLERAQKLAAHIGSEVLGEEQLGW